MAAICLHYFSSGNVLYCSKGRKLFQGSEPKFCHLNKRKKKLHDFKIFFSYIQICFYPLVINEFQFTLDIFMAQSLMCISVITSYWEDWRLKDTSVVPQCNRVLFQPTWSVKDTYKLTKDERRKVEKYVELESLSYGKRVRKHVV